MKAKRVNREQIRVISAITSGNVLEWYEIYSYAYLAPLLARIFFNFKSELSNLTVSFAFFGLGLFARACGAVLFGKMGDLKGRKVAFIRSITWMTGPTFLIGFLPTYQDIGLLSPILLALLRLLQAIPSAGEVPGSVCFLYEYSDQSNKRFMTSWVGFGNQVGAILGVTEAYFLHHFLSPEFFSTWGWRISFWSGGILGLLGLVLRRTLHETPVFEHLKELEELDRETETKVVKKNYKKIAKGIAYGAINAVTFYMLATYLPTYFSDVLKLTEAQNAIISILILVLTTILLPVFGILGDKYSNRKILSTLAILTIILTTLLYFSINSQNLIWIGIIGFAFIIPIAGITALLAYQVVNLFPPRIRYRGLGLSFNLSDGFFGGFAPAISLLLVKYSQNEGAFCFFIIFCSLLSLFFYLRIKD